MTTKTTPKKYRFNMPELCRRARKSVRKKHKKTVSLSEIRAVWKDYVKYGLVEVMIKEGKVQVDKNFSLEIVGQRILDNPKMSAIFKRGVGIRGAMVTQGANLHKGRDEFFYKIVAENKHFKDGLLLFDADPQISAAVHKALVNPYKHYRIV